MFRSGWGSGHFVLKYQRVKLNTNLFIIKLQCSPPFQSTPKHNANHWFLLCCLVIFFTSECSKHCSLCYNDTECYECTQGFYLNGVQECERKSSGTFHIIKSSSVKSKSHKRLVSTTNETNPLFILQNVQSTAPCATMAQSVMNAHRDFT